MMWPSAANSALDLTTNISTLATAALHSTYALILQKQLTSIASWMRCKRLIKTTMLWACKNRDADFEHFHAWTQDLDKKESAAEKQRESIMVGFNKTKSELGTLQDALAKTQIDLEKTNFELHAKKSEPLSLAGLDKTHDALSAALCATRTFKSCCSRLPEQMCDALQPVCAQPCDCLQMHQPAEGSQWGCTQTYAKDVAHAHK